MNNLSSSFGVKLKSEFADPKIYLEVRLIQNEQIIKFKTSPKNLIIDEIQMKNTFFYTIINTKTKLKGFVGRCYKTGAIIFLIKDSGREKWGTKEGFSDGDLYAKVGILIRAVSGSDLSLFLAGKPGWKTEGDYIKA